MEFIVTIDTEGDNQWDHGRELTVENVKFVPRFQALCDRYHIKPTYMVTSEICEDPFAQELFRDYQVTGKAEIGAHLHSWTTPPYRDRDGLRLNDRNHTFAHELPDLLLNEKIKILTEQIEKAFGKRPLSFRSGRYGFNSHVAKALVSNNYIVDSSITPMIDWSGFKGLPGGPGGPDFMDKTAMPFRYRINGKSLLEIPITVLPTKFPLNKSAALAKCYFRNVGHNILLRAIRRLAYNHQPLWLRPNHWMTNGLFNDLIEEAKRLRLPHIVMMFHSSELMPGSSRYWPNEDSVEILFYQLEGLFNLVHDKQIESATLTEAAQNFL